MSQAAPIYADVDLDTPLKRGDEEITRLRLRKPNSGELRGLTLVDLTQCDVAALIKLLPRISQPVLTPAEAAALDPADLLALATEVSDFLLQKAKKPASQET